VSRPVDVPLVSVITPMYNAAAFIGDALESVAAQDHPAIEVILVDDGSTDDSASVARAHAERLGLDATIVRQENQGPAIARNLALDHVRGRLVTLLDADDRMTPDRVGFGVRHLRDHPEVDAVIGTHENVVDPGVPIPDWLPRLPPSDRIPHYLVVTVLARVELFDRVGRFDPTYQFAGEDTEWYLRAKTAGANFDLVDHLMVWRRIHGANLTFQVEDLDRALFRLLRERARRERQADRS
jgi:glycosyltransferase involved in cell wall biosynthesis